MNMATIEIKGKLVENYKYSTYAKRAKARIQEIANMVKISYSTYSSKTNQSYIFVVAMRTHL